LQRQRVFKDARRSDLSSFGKGVTTPAGYMQVDAALTRTGIFEYFDFWTGAVVRELRHPDDVFHSDSLATLPMIPVTALHPPEQVNSTTAKKYQAGSVGETIKQEGELVTARVCITDATLLGMVAGGMREVSCGYTCDIDPTPGEWNGQKYDARQLNIRYDHVAVVPKGRAGEEVRLRIDASQRTDADSRPNVAAQRQDSQSGSVEPQHEEKKMKIKLQGKEFEVAEDVGQAFSAELEAANKATQAAVAQTDSAKKEADKEKGRADALQASLDQEKKAHADAVDPQKRKDALKARVKLEKDAAKFLGDDKLDDKDDLDIKKAVIAKALPKAKLDGCSAEYIEGVFATVLEASADKNDSLSNLRQAGTPPSTEQTKADEAQSKMVEEQRKANAEYMKRN
jgi:hypothetical protein